MPVYKQGVEDSIKSSLLTTIGDIIGASAVSTPARIAAPASGQVFTGQGAGVLPAWAAAASGVTRAGGNTTEATTTSTTTVDLLSVSSLSIAAGVPAEFWAVIRKTVGNSAPGVGLKVNATIVWNPSGRTAAFSTANQIESGTYKVHLFANTTNYLQAAVMNLEVNGASESNLILNVAATLDAVLPAATITDLIIEGIAPTSGSPSTLGADEAHVYTYAIS